MPAQTYIPVARYRANQVTNGGTTIQNVTSNRSENRTVTDTKNLQNVTVRALTNSENRTVTDTKALQNITARALTEVVQADIGGTVTFKVVIPTIYPVRIPPQFPVNPNTT